jgi:hypothetical protein
MPHRIVAVVSCFYTEQLAHQPKHLFLKSQNGTSEPQNENRNEWRMGAENVAGKMETTRIYFCR